MKPVYSSPDGDPKPENGRKIIMHPLYGPRSSPWLEIRVFYIRITNSSSPNHLTLNHIPLSLDTVIDVNGSRSSIYTEWISSSLRRVDRNSEEATYVTTDSMKVTGSVRFQVFDKDDLLLTGDLELSNENGNNGNGARNGGKRWAMKCRSEGAVVEVYIAGSFSGTPIVLTESGLRKTNGKRNLLRTIPEHEMVEEEQELDRDDDLKVTEYQDPKQPIDTDTEDSNIYYTGEDGEYLEDKDGELSWFNAGVRVGVGIGLGICVGIGLGVGLMVSTYQSTARNFRRRLL